MHSFCEIITDQQKGLTNDCMKVLMKFDLHSDSTLNSLD